jgi:hypothetical protein
MVTLNGEGQKRLPALIEVLAGRMTAEEMAEMPGSAGYHPRHLIAG